MIDVFVVHVFSRGIDFFLISFFFFYVFPTDSRHRVGSEVCLHRDAWVGIFIGFFNIVPSDRVRVNRRYGFRKCSTLRPDDAINQNRF